ncbi:hypothetical protein [Virgibacillus salexigens]|uniref:hypothetical protein n=1 Tax=Virgibacillus massiliensis TaxID=1462526 RepID=UPI00157EF2D0|nr:hypothetical protein [Virgibacillus massiliensis]MYL43973.1 hypothetical protein [Virgibacillus massiliensis]
MAKLNPKEKKEKKDIAKQMMEFYGINYNEWLHEKHQDFINEHLMDYMKEQEKQIKKQPGQDGTGNQQNLSDNNL